MDPHVSKQDPKTFWTNGEGSGEKFPQKEKVSQHLFFYYVVGALGGRIESTNLYLKLFPQLLTGTFSFYISQCYV